MYTTRHLTRVLLATLIACVCGAQLVAGAATSEGVTRLPYGFVLAPTSSTQKVRLQVMSSRIIHVTVVPRGRFNKLPSSLMVVEKPQDANFTLHVRGLYVDLVTPTLTVRVFRKTGAIQFLHPDGKVILDERPNGRTFTPVVVHGYHYYAIRQQWLSPSDEAFYGLGQHQNGVMNYKGKDVRLAQHNGEIAIPFVVSSQNYGVLWDNNSITRFGDPRPYLLMGKSLRLFNSNGKSGSLTASYYKKGKLELRRDESEINYKYITDRKKWPTSPTNKSDTYGNPGQSVVWTGSIASDVGGAHKFKLFVSGHYELHINHKMVVRGWRQANAWFRYFTLIMKPGVRYPIKLQWKSPGRIALEQLNPLSKREQNELSLHSQLAQSIDYYFIYGKNINNVIAGYRQLTGKAVLLPRWAYGYWQSQDCYNSQAKVLAVAARYRSLGLPIDNIVQDACYWKKGHMGSDAFDSTRYPDPKGMIKTLHDKHFHLMISVWPKFPPETDNYKALKVAGDLFHAYPGAKLPRMHGIQHYYTDFYDAFSLNARKLYWQQIYSTLGRDGVDAWWLDADEPELLPPTSLAEHERLMGTTPLGPGAAVFNAYPLMTTSAVYHGSQRSWPNRRVFILSRSSFGGVQRNDAASWSGDTSSTWRQLRDQISAAVNFSMSGIPNWTSDIGGFYPKPRYYEHPAAAALREWRELYVRWFQFGAFSPIFRAHGSHIPRAISKIASVGSKTYDDLAWYDRLRYRLMPYIYTVAANTWWKNGSIVLGLPAVFPHDHNVRDINDEYMFGPAFLVAPVTRYMARTRKVYLPAGSTWYDFNTGKRYIGGETIRAAAPLSRIPLFVRAGSIIPTGVKEEYVNEYPDEPITLLVYAGANGHFSLYEDDGTTENYRHGQYSRVPLAYDNTARILTIGSRLGDGTGAPHTRKFIIRLIGSSPQNPNGLKSGDDVVIEYHGKKMRIQLARKD